MKLLLSTLFIILFTSCAGPTTPFGGQVLIGEKFRLDQSFTPPENINFKFSPERQYYNSPYDLQVSIVDPSFDINSFRYEILYNNRLLNRWMKTEEIQFPSKKNEPIKITFKNLSILPGNINKISFLYYPKGSETPIIHKLEVPECLKEKLPEKMNLSPFNISKSLKNNIQNISEKYGYNSNLIAALIAQESSFNPKALSFAKALGLTQVTPMAHEEINRFKKEWKIHPLFLQTNVLNLRTKLKENKINSFNDWRLDEKKSIEGGILYMNYLSDYWSQPNKQAILADAFQHDVPELDILLASYNSGPARVSRAIASHKKHWLFDKNLNEARKYVMNIKSYCYSFNQGITHEE